MKNICIGAAVVGSAALTTYFLYKNLKTCNAEEDMNERVCDTSVENSSFRNRISFSILIVSFSCGRIQKTTTPQIRTRTVIVHLEWLPKLSCPVFFRSMVQKRLEKLNQLRNGPPRLTLDTWDFARGSCLNDVSHLLYLF